jgi:acyl-[acyl carrier protein]--UDP-N-acetylglucosamine O-acyltransferase
VTRDQTAIVGHNPEGREWKPGDPVFAPQIAATARLEAFVSVDAGMREPTRVGERSWLMKHCHCGHDAQIGADCELAPGAVVCGHAALEDGVRVGVNASILPFVRVGKGARIGAGAVVTRDVPAGEVWAGNPARNLHDRTWRSQMFAVAEMAKAIREQTVAAEAAMVREKEQNAMVRRSIAAIIEAPSPFKRSGPSA